MSKSKSKGFFSPCQLFVVLAGKPSSIIKVAKGKSMYELFTAAAALRRLPGHFLPCASHVALLAPQRQCPAWLLACPVPPCPGTWLLPQRLRDALCGRGSCCIPFWEHAAQQEPLSSLAGCGKEAPVPAEGCVSHQNPTASSPSGLMCLLCPIPLTASHLCSDTVPGAPASAWLLTSCVTLTEVTSARLSPQVSLP